MDLTEQQRKDATIAVLTWLEETCGKDIADTWAWCHTPMPCGLPLDEQLEEGLAWAAVGREAALPMMRASREAYEQYVREAMAELRAKGQIP